MWPCLLLLLLLLQWIDIYAGLQELYHQVEALQQWVEKLRALPPYPGPPGLLRDTEFRVLMVSVFSGLKVLHAPDSHLPELPCCSNSTSSANTICWRRILANKPWI
jgi:hypothetical protein